jgi:4,5-DOPA dioxygenase extradiol
MKQPLLFIGHGSPMNAIESNIYTESWKKIWKSLEKPRAILIFSAHWITEWQTLISSNKNPEMIYDMYGFPPELYQVQYDAPWSREIAEEIYSLLNNPKISLDASRGFDHGVWSTLIHSFPQADVPIITMSLDYLSSPRELYALGDSLAILRDKWILIIWSGNIVHNLGATDWSGKHTYPWAIEFDKKVANLIESRDHDQLLDFKNWWDIFRLAHPSYDHLLPIFPLLGASSLQDAIEFFTPDIVMGSLSMRSVKWG